MSRINFVREIKQKNRNNFQERKREDGWNDRFYLGKISDYKPYTINNNLDDLKQTKRHFKSNRDNTSANRIPPSKSSISNDDMNSDPYKRIQHLWDDLGVRIPYKTLFDSIAKQLSGSLQNDFYQYEYQSLVKFDECLTKYSKEISNREKAIFLLQKLDQVLGKSIRDGTSSINDTIIKDIIQTIRNLRVYSINVVNHMNRIREICSYSTISGKFDLDSLNGKYMFNRNYLIKMRFDLDFLAQSNLSIFFNFSESSDPFLHAASHEDIANGKVAIPIGEDILKAIHLCQYIIMQDIIFYQLQGDREGEGEEDGMDAQFRPISTQQLKKDYDSNNNIGNISTNKIGGGNNRIQSVPGESNFSERVVIESKIKDKIGGSNGNDNSYYKNKKSNMNSHSNIIANVKNNKKIERDSIPSVNRDDIEQRMKEYDILQKNLEIDRELIGKRNEDLSKERELDEKKEKETMKEEEGVLIPKQNKEIANKKDNKGKDKDNKDKDKDKDEKDDDDDVNINWLNVVQNEKATEENQQKPSNTQKNQVDADIDNQITQTKPNQYSEDQTSNRYDSPILSSHNVVNNSLLRKSLTPKSHAKQLQKTLKFSYYTGDIDDFIPIYNKYYSTISKDQRIIFNIKENPINAITSTFNPKIIFCTNAQNKYDIKGLCILCFDMENASIGKVNIIHLSSIHQNEDIILSTLIEYIKSTIYCSQIDIDLYYQFENNKFTINKELRDLFKNTLGFRWSRLENLAQHIRYQKMYLKTCQENPIIDNYSLTISKPLFNIKHYSVITIASNRSLNSNNEGEGARYDKYINAFSVLYLTNWLKNQGMYSINNDSSAGFNWDIKGKDSNSYINCSLGDYNQKKALLVENDINCVFNNNSKALSIIDYMSALMQLNPYFNSNISGVIDNIYYNRLQGPINRLRHNETNQIYYLIPTVDGFNSIIICQMNALTKQALIERNGNIYQLFNSFYHQFEPIEDSANTVLWVPAFDINTHLVTQQFDCIDRVVLKKDNEEVFLACYDEYIKVNFDYDNNNHAAFSIKAKKEDVVITNSFLLGVINLNVLSSFEFSTVLLLNVTKEHWKIKKK